MRHVIFASFVLLLCAPAGAQSGGGAEPKAAAKKAWKEGATHYEAGRYARAIEKFKQSYEISPSPNTLFSLGQAYRKNGDDANAIDCFRRYLHDRVDAPNRELVEELIHEIEGRNPALKLPATATAGGGSQTPAPRPAPEPTPPPVSAPPSTAAPAEAASAVPPEAIGGGAPVERRRWTSDGVGVSLLVGGVVATGVGATLIVISGSKSDDARGTIDETEAVDQNSSAKTLRTVGVISTAVGVAAIGAGVVKLFVLPRPPRERPIAWTVTPGGIVVSGSF